MIPIIIFLFTFLIYLISLYIDPFTNKKITGSNDIQIIQTNINFLYEKCKQFFVNKTFKPICRYSELKSIPYKEYNNIRFGCHMGQRKLLLSELQFYSDYCTQKKEIIVYAGSAPCQHLTMLIELFPNLIFILVDPNYHNFDYNFQYVYQNFNSINIKNKNIMLEYLQDKDSLYYNNILYQTKCKTIDNKEFNAFNKDSYEWEKYMKEFYNTNNYDFSNILKSNQKVYVIQDYMDIELCKKIKHKLGNLKINFVSDLRTNMFKSYPTDLDIIWNDCIQASCIHILNPNYSMLKFHPPYFNKDDDSVITYNNYVKNNKNNKNNKNKIIKVDNLYNITYDIIHNNINYVNKNLQLSPIKNYLNNKYEYLDNIDIYLQAWAPRSSTETRLIIKNIPKNINYNFKEWDNKFTFYKSIRMYGYFSYFYNLVKDYKNDDIINDYNAGFDSMLEIYIILNYIYKTKMDYKKFNKKIDLNKLFEIKYKIDKHLNYTISDRCNMIKQLTCSPTDINIYYTINDKNKVYIKNNKVSQKYVGHPKKIKYKLINC